MRRAKLSNYVKYWGDRGDLNPRPSESQSDTPFKNQRAKAQYLLQFPGEFAGFIETAGSADFIIFWPIPGPLSPGCHYLDSIGWSGIGGAHD